MLSRFKRFEGDYFLSFTEAKKGAKLVTVPTTIRPSQESYLSLAVGGWSSLKWWVSDFKTRRVFR
jgi:hypothetical protein